MLLAGLWKLCASAVVTGHLPESKMKCFDGRWSCCSLEVTRNNPGPKAEWVACVQTLLSLSVILEDRREYAVTLKAKSTFQVGRGAARGAYRTVISMLGAMRSLRGAQYLSGGSRVAMRTH